MTMNKIKICLFCAFAAVLTSCHVQKEIPYFQDIAEQGIGAKPALAETTVCPNDMLTILVSTLDPISSAPFNLPLTSYTSPGSDKISTQNTLQSYLVDKNGNIQFPVLGEVNVGGKTKNETVIYLQELLSNYLKDPIVNINVINFQISVLGEVNKPGQFKIENERVIILDALAMAGDLTIYGKRNSVLLFRIDGKGNKTAYRIDLTKKALFDSPYYYLQQNDVIYVEPNRTKSRESRYSPNLSILISAISTAISAATLIYTLTK